MKLGSIAVAVLVMSLVTCAGARAWEGEYDAGSGMLPTAASPGWKLYSYHEVAPALTDGALRIQHTASDGQAYFYREAWAIDKFVPVTMEARVRITPTSGNGAAVMSVETRSGGGRLMIYPDRLEADCPTVFYADFTAFRTVRLAYDGARNAYAWVDNQPALSWNTGGPGQNGVNFGSYWGTQPYDSYWQYVAYSKQFLPIPEPSSLAALLAGLAGFGAAMRRRRKT
jgi:hypothetical protein